LFVVTHSVVAAHIYREDLPKVTVSHNRLGLSLSKHIRHGLIVKINGKRRLRTCETLGRILVDYSHACRVPHTHRLDSPCHAIARVYFSLSPLLYTLASA
jgi:hypothetical protein